MLTQLTTTLAAATIAITGAAAPAMAGPDEDLLAKILLGAAVVGIGAKIIDNRKDRKEAEARRAAEVSRARHEHHDRAGWIGRTDRVIEGEITGAWGHGPKPGRGYKRDPLPVGCRVTVETPKGTRPGYSSNCLTRSYKQAKHLPGQCEVVVRTSRGLRAVYGERCLDRDGWQTPAAY